MQQQLIPSNDMTRKIKQIDIRFKLLNREAILVSSLLSNGLANFRNIAKGDGYYYQAFYSVSIGLERLLKLLILSKSKRDSVKGFNHDIKKLFSEVNIAFVKGSIEESVVNFLNEFASKNRYLIPDILVSNDLRQLSKEPMSLFVSDVLNRIIKIHQPRKIFIPPSDFPVDVLHTAEDFSEVTSLQDMMIKSQLTEYASKYLVMYTGRIIQPILSELYKVEGAEYGNPYYGEIFVYLHQGDSYFKTRKTYKL